MPKLFIDRIRLYITRPYEDLFSFYCKKLKCLGLIEDLTLTLAHIPTKSVVRDIVVEDILAILTCYCFSLGKQDYEQYSTWTFLTHKYHCLVS